MLQCNVWQCTIADGKILNAKFAVWFIILENIVLVFVDVVENYYDKMISEIKWS